MRLVCSAYHRFPWLHCREQTPLHLLITSNGTNLKEFLIIRQSKESLPIITWNQGGNDVAVEGSWDNWRSSEQENVKEMAGHKIAHATLKGPSVVKELVIGLTLGLAAGGLWKMHHLNEQRKTRAFYDLLEKGEIGVVVAEE